ncbi:MAG: radical SAM protein [Chloroflexi bacterium]|nr:radical SAM protein [Chloroflexota bacterium]
MTERTYITLYKSGELAARAVKLQEQLYDCNICPRACHVNRFENIRGFCGSGQLTSISSYCDHHGEEPALSGTRGSGTIFFHNCNLRCKYCQNHQISQGTDNLSRTLSCKELAAIMLHLQNDLGCHNINFVSPSHYVPQIVEALCHAIPGGLHIPLIYNTNGYDSLDTLKMLDGVIDIYLPDLKYADNRYADEFSNCSNYVESSRPAIKEMYRQAGKLVSDESGIAQSGLIVRHLILPNDIAGSADSLRWLASDISKDVTVSVMAQYYPCFLAWQEPMLSRKITPAEYARVVEVLQELHLDNGWLQEIDSSEFYLPDFQRQGHPFSR